MTPMPNARVPVEGHLSTLTLHRLRYGELEEEALSEARAHLACCPRCSARLAVQQQERAAFVLQPMPEAIRQIAEPARRSWWRELLPLVGALAAAAALFIAVPVLRTQPASPIEGVAYRGEDPPQATVRARPHSAPPIIEAWVDQGQGLRRLGSGDKLGMGDRVQLAYDPRGSSSVAIAGRDSSGLVEVYTTRAPTGVGLVKMPFALTLDGAPGVQELFVVGSDRPLDELRVKAAIMTGVPGTRVARIVIPKKEGHR